MSDLSGLNPTPHAIALYASRPLSPGATQHSLPSGRCPLLGPVFHRLDRTSLPGALIRSPRRRGRAASAGLADADEPVVRAMHMLLKYRVAGRARGESVHVHGELPVRRIPGA